MISHASKRANGWSPHGFEDFAEHYPQTLWRQVPEAIDLTSEFLAAWSETSQAPVTHATSVIITPGLFAEWLPGCCRAPRRAFAAAGHRVLQSSVRSNMGIRSQAERIRREAAAWLMPEERFVWLGHSKGGLELLWALDSDEDLRERCIAAVVVQPPVGASRVIERWRSPRANLTQRLRYRIAMSRPFAAGVRDIGADRDPAISDWLAAFEPCVPTICVVSWSIDPTSWVDSFHRTLAAACPGHAHDGQVLLVDQVLPDTTLVCLPQVDHAQAVLGGHGFDCARFWRTLAAIAVQQAASPAPDAHTR
jgi:hypothetical protein